MSEWRGILLDDAKAWLRKHVVKGARCPCCNQMAKVYRRNIHSSMARALVKLYLAGPGFQQLVSLLEHREIADAAKLSYWGLLEEEPEVRPDGGRTGWWRLTPAGERFARGETSVPKYAHIYDGRCLGLDGPQVSIREALGHKFDLDELMRA